tara:strand:- start:926 stop:1795 length:870 start_codon:yes stop_codon:yes gene_type:complete
MNKSEGLELGRAAARADIATMRSLLKALIATTTKTPFYCEDDVKRRGTWAYFANKTLQYLDNKAPSPFQIWNLKGNIKLPFAAFSALPQVTCPGAGPCLDFCYSFKSWRYPAPYFRQLVNTLLMATPHGRDVIAVATAKLPENIAIRLYVDGDFANVGQVNFWMEQIAKRPDLSVYGYSKSWQELLAYTGNWPSNYLLNLSNGGNAEHLRADVARLPIARGDFLTVDIDSKLAGKYDDKAYKTAVRAAAKSAGIDRPFVCPGRCGACTKSGHFCGRSDTAGVSVVIGVH